MVMKPPDMRAQLSTVRFMTHEIMRSLFERVLFPFKIGVLIQQRPMLIV